MHEFWQPIYFWGQKVKGKVRRHKKQCWRWFLHSCECWHLLVTKWEQNIMQTVRFIYCLCRRLTTTVHPSMFTRLSLSECVPEYQSCFEVDDQTLCRSLPVFYAAFSAVKSQHTGYRLLTTLPEYRRTLIYILEPFYC